MNNIIRYIVACVTLGYCLSSCNSDDNHGFTITQGQPIQSVSGKYTPWYIYHKGKIVESGDVPIGPGVVRNQVDVTLTESGTLADKLSGQTEAMDGLSISGHMNLDDAKFIIECAKIHPISMLDLKNAEFDNGKIPDGAFCTENITDGKIDPMKLVRLQIYNLILPENTLEIGDAAFAGLMLTAIDIPKSVRKLGKYCFADHFLSTDYKDTENNTLVIPDGIEQIPEGAFFSNRYRNLEFQDYRSHVNEISLPSSVRHIGDKAFSGISTKHITLGNGIETIGNSAFSDNMIIETLVLPKSLVSIGGECFCHMPQLKEIRSLNPVPPEISTDGASAFSCGSSVHLEEANYFETPLSAVLLYVPVGSISEYSSSNGWEHIVKIVETSEL